MPLYLGAKIAQGGEHLNARMVTGSVEQTPQPAVTYTSLQPHSVPGCAHLTQGGDGSNEENP